MKPEQALVHAVMDWLIYNKILCYRTRNSGTIIHGPRWIIYGRDRWWRTQQGCADILAWHNGKSYALELKSSTGRLSEEQSAWLKNFCLAGGTAIVARSLDDVIALFDGHEKVGGTV